MSNSVAEVFFLGKCSFTEEAGEPRVSATLPRSLAPETIPFSCGGSMQDSLFQKTTAPTEDVSVFLALFLLACIFDARLIPSLLPM